jgi:serine/threonine protein kinase
LHAGGIVHRDLKPSKLLLERRVRASFRVKIVDFGIARVLGSGAPRAAPPRGVLDTAGFVPFVCSIADRNGRTATSEATWRDLTSTGRVLGTPRYMAPELAFGAKHASPSSDLWSLGVIAYQLGCGHLPFDAPAPSWPGRFGECRQSLPRQGFGLDVQLLPESLRDLVARCLDRDPAQRPTAAAVAAMLA